MEEFERVQVSLSYSIRLPKLIERNFDNGVWGYWLEGKEVVLQLSSRVSPNLLVWDTAKERMDSRPSMIGMSETWDEVIHPAYCPDWASRGCKDGHGFTYIFTDCVWPGLHVLATIIGPDSDAPTGFEWAREAIRSIERTD